MAEGGTDDLDISGKLLEDKQNTPVVDNTKRVIPSEAIEQFSKAVIGLCEPEITSIHDRVKEILCNQGVVRDSTQNELTQLQQCAMLTDIVNTFENVKLYHKKLTNMKKDMGQLLDRAEKTKIRAEKLKLQKEREELEIAREKERHIKYEKELTAKPAAAYSASSNSST